MTQPKPESPQSLDRDSIRAMACEYYLRSSDFNGLPFRAIADPDAADSRQILLGLAKDHIVDIAIQELNSNPYMNRLGFASQEDLIAAIPDADLVHAVLYPTAQCLLSSVDPARYFDRPYDLRLALGDPQLSLRYFDISILEWYRQDPRYYYRVDDIRGSIGVKDEFYESDTLHTRDKIHLQTFGIAYSDAKRPAVCVFLRYLKDLEPDHQLVWRSRELTSRHRPHPDYWKNTIEGGWGSYVSIYEAVLLEFELINRMCKAIGWEPLFRCDYRDDRPKEFGLMLRPTAKHFGSFVQLADKMLSDNLNQNFFQGYVPLEEEVEKDNGRYAVNKIGSIRLLESWISKYFRPEDPEPIKRMIGVFKEVRKGRNPEAHSIQDDSFDHGYFDRQRELIGRIYGAVRLVRLMFASHPKARGVAVPEVLQTGEQIWHA